MVGQRGGVTRLVSRTRFFTSPRKRGEGAQRRAALRACLKFGQGSTTGNSTLTVRPIVAFVARGRGGCGSQGQHACKKCVARQQFGGDMSEETGGAGRMPASGSYIRNPRDFWGGVVMIAFGLFALWATYDLPGMRGFAFGPGTAPRMFAYVLIGLGAIISLTGLFTDGPHAEQYAVSGPLSGTVVVVACLILSYYSPRVGRLVPGLPPDIVVAVIQAAVMLALAIALTKIAPRGPVLVTAAVLIFAVTVRPLGLVFSTFITILISASATHEVRWIETVIWGAVLTLFCSLLFPYALNLPLQMWPRF
jgi:hypothetical protein